MNLFNSKTVLSFDFATKEIKVVEGKYSKKGVVVNNSFSVSVPKDIYNDGIIHDIEHLTYLLGQALNANNVTLGQAYGVINSTKIIIREIMVPKVDDKEVDSILHYQLEDFIPVNVEEYVVNYLNLGPILYEGLDKIKLMIICVPKTIVEPHLNLFKNLGLKPVILDYRGNSIRKLLMTNSQINGTNEITGSIATIDFGYDASAITVIDGDVLKVSRLIEVGWKYLIEFLNHLFPELNEDELYSRTKALNDIKEDSEPNDDECKIINGVKLYINDVLPDFEMIFRYYSAREVGNVVDLIVLLGGFYNIAGIDNIFTKFFNKPTIRLEYLDRVKFEGKLFRYANAIGGLIRLDEVK